MQSTLGKVHVYWGNGKGKTTASLGLALRALGNGFKVHLVQFMKCGLEGGNYSEYGELFSLEKFGGFSVARFGAKEWVVGKPSEAHLSEAKNAVDHAKKALSSGAYDLVILDEVLYAVQLGLLSEQQVVELIDSKNKNIELVLTGSHKPFGKIFKRADLITEMKKHKHYFDDGLSARKGVEF